MKIVTIKLIFAFSLSLWCLASSSNSHAEEAMMATMSPPGSPSRFVYDRLLEHVETQTNGTYIIKPFFSGELGPEESYFQAMRRGRIQLSAVSGQGIGTAVPEYAVLRAPYLFESFDELAFIYDAFLTDMLSELFADKGIFHLQWAANGWENIYSQSPITTPADIEGYRIRVPLEPNAVLFFGAVNADVIQIPFTDIIPSLQTGLIDGGESTALMYVQAGLYTEAGHFTETRHGFSLAVYAANKRWFDRLPEDIQNVFRTAYMKPTDAFAVLDSQTNEALDKIVAEGDVIMHRLTADERGRWQQSTSAAVRKIIDQTGGRAADLYDRVVAGKAAFGRRENN